MATFDIPAGLLAPYAWPQTPGEYLVPPEALEPFRVESVKRAT